MASSKTATLMLRLDPAVKHGLRALAARERRSLANMVEVMIIEYSRQRGIAIPEAPPSMEVIPSTT